MRPPRRTTITVVAVIAGLFASAAVAHAQTVASTTTVSVAPNPSVAGQLTTLTAVVAATGGTPTGSVQFSADGFLIGGPVQLSEGRADLEVWAAAGDYIVTAAYGGDSSFDPSTGSAPATVVKANTVTTVASPTNPAPSGSGFVLLVTVGIEPPGDVPAYGFVQASVNGTPHGAPVPVDGASSVAVPIGGLAGPQNATISVSYSGDDNTNPSSASLVQQIAGPPIPPPPTPTPTPTTPAAMTAAMLKQMTASLRGILRRRGLAGLSGATQTLATPVAGRLEQVVYTPSPTARKRTVLAKARRTFAAGGTGKLTLRMTAAGRRKLRNTTKLKLAIVTRFTPRTGSPVTVVDRLTARKRSARAARALSWRVVKR